MNDEYDPFHRPEEDSPEEPYQELPESRFEEEAPASAGSEEQAAPAFDNGGAPSPGPFPKEALHAGTPWDRRRQSGFVEAMIDSCRLILFHPSRFFQQLAPSGGFGEPLFFFIAFSILVSLFSFPATMLARVIDTKLSFMVMPRYLEWLQSINAPAGAIDLLRQAFERSPRVQDLLLQQLCCSGASPLAWVVMLFVIAAFYSVIGLLFSGKIDYEMVFRVLAFAEAARCTWIVNPVPTLRELVFFLHWFILLAIGFKHTGSLSTGKAILMALLPLLLCILLMFCCCCGSFGLSWIPGMAG